MPPARCASAAQTGPFAPFPHLMWGRGGTCPPLGAGGWLGTELVPIVPHVGPRAPRAPLGGPTGVGSGVSSGPSALREQVSSSSQAVAVAWAQPGLSAPPTQITLWGPSWALRGVEQHPWPRPLSARSTRPHDHRCRQMLPSAPWGRVAPARTTGLHFELSLLSIWQAGIT